MMKMGIRFKIMLIMEIIRSNDYHKTRPYTDGYSKGFFDGMPKLKAKPVINQTTT